MFILNFRYQFERMLKSVNILKQLIVPASQLLLLTGRMITAESAADDNLPLQLLSFPLYLMES